MSWIWRNLIISTILAVAVFVYLIYSEAGTVPNTAENRTGLLFTIVAANITGILIFLISHRLNRYLSWNKRLTIRFLAEAGISLIIIIVMGFILSLVFFKHAIPLDDGGSFWFVYRDAIIKFLIISLAVVYIYTVINFSIFSFNQYSVVRIESIKIEREQIRLQFDALKSQLSPHYLFNSLNNISSLIYSDINSAELFIRNLAIMYQYILKTNEQKLVFLHDELDAVFTYYSLQKIKYEEYIDLKINISPYEKKLFIPPLVLQMLVENALKHNAISEDNPMLIEIFSENQKYLVVRNNYIPKSELIKIGQKLVDRPKKNTSHKIGLENIKKRYNFFTDKEILVSANKYFTVKLPLITEKIEQTTFL